MSTLKNKSKKSYQIIAVDTLKLSIGGILIGLLHQYDLILAGLLGIHFIRFIIKNYLVTNDRNWVLLLGMIVSGILGISAEMWGVSNGFWEYHDLSNNRQLPYWLPLAWMYAFRFIYLLERKLIVALQLESIRQKTWLAVAIAAFFPAYGEVITINLGVWTYTWPYQFLGVPLYAVLCLIAFHMGINFILTLWVKRKKIDDPVFISKK